METPQQQAQRGLREIENAIVRLLEQRAEGLTNAELAAELGIETGDHNEHRNMLSWSIIGRLVQAGRLERVTEGKRKLLRIRTT